MPSTTPPPPCPHCSSSPKTKSRTDDEKKSLIHRLNRIEGQIGGLRRMIEEEAYCADILTQSSAVSAALSAFSREVLDTHIRTCVKENILAGNDDSIEELLELLKKIK